MADDRLIEGARKQTSDQLALLRHVILTRAYEIENGLWETEATNAE